MLACFPMVLYASELFVLKMLYIICDIRQNLESKMFFYAAPVKIKRRIARRIWSHFCPALFPDPKLFIHDLSQYQASHCVLFELFSEYAHVNRIHLKIFTLRMENSIRGLYVRVT